MLYYNRAYLGAFPANNGKKKMETTALSPKVGKTKSR